MRPLPGGASWWGPAAAVLTVVALRIVAHLRSEAARERLGDGPVSERVPVTRWRWWNVVRLVLLAGGAGLAAAAVSVGAHRAPSRSGPAPEARTALVLDLSASMRARDAAGGDTPRIVRAAELASAVARRTTGRVGLVVYAERSRVVVPMTTDPGTVADELQALAVVEATGGGSRPAAGLRAAGGVLGTDTAPSRRAVVFTDGESASAGALEAARALERQGVRLVAVGIGSRSGARVPETGGEGWIPDGTGSAARSELRGGFLRDLVGEVGGTYVPGSTRVSRVVQAAGGEAASADEEVVRGEGSRRTGVGLALAAFVLLWIDGFMPRPPVTETGR